MKKVKQKNYSKMENELNITVEKGVKELVVRHGDALPLKEPTRVDVAGNIDAVTRFITNRVEELEQKNCHILVDRDCFNVQLIVEEHDFYSDRVKASLALSKEFKEFQINTGKLWTSFELADFIRMHRSFFQKSDEAAKLVTSLRGFKAKVNRDIENSDDNRGNRDIVRRQVVESNLPESFKLELEVFKGQGKQIIEIEVDIDADSLNCSLVSPMANEIIETTSNEIIDDELEAISKVAPALLIIEK